MEDFDILDLDCILNIYHLLTLQFCLTCMAPAYFLTSSITRQKLIEKNASYLLWVAEFSVDGIRWIIEVLELS